MSVLGSGDFRRAVQTEDVKRLTAVPGIGLKGAQKIVIELKDKVALLAAVEGEDDAVVSAAPSDDAWRGQVVDGLQGLGWSVRDAEAAKKYIEMGVMRLGTSNGIKIVAGEAVTGGY